MKNKDVLQQEKQKIIQRMNQAITEGDNEGFGNAFEELSMNIQEAVMAEALEIQSSTDTTVLASRGVRQLTSEENKYYQKVIEAMSSSNPKQALSDLGEVMPKTTIDSVFEDLEVKHPLLEAINFQNTSGLIETILNTDGAELASWSTLTAEITKELTSGFKKTNMSMNKLSAFLPVAKAMLDLGPAWLDRYTRTILSEALYNGLEEAIVNGTGKNMPIGMNRQVGEGVTVTDGIYPIKDPITLVSFDPISYGNILAKLAKTPKNNDRVVSNVILLVNPTDYLTKVMPATTILRPDGTYANNVFPYPTNVIQSTRVPVGKAIIGLGSKYFMGIGTAKSGKLEYSDEYRFLEDERVYLVKLYGHGEPLDNNAFLYLDISGLEPTIKEVSIKGTVATKPEA